MKFVALETEVAAGAILAHALRLPSLGARGKNYQDLTIIEKRAVDILIGMSPDGKKVGVSKKQPDNAAALLARAVRDQWFLKLAPIRPRRQ